MKYSKCFVCGHDNPSGLKLDFGFEGESAFTWFTSPATFEGYQGVIHGGIIATLLDEVMAKIILSKKLVAVTADMNVRYRKALLTGTRVKVSGEITLQKTRTIHTKAVVQDENGTIYAESTAVYIVVGKL